MILQSPSQGWGSLLWHSLEFLVKENECCVSLIDTDRIPNILTACRVEMEAPAQSHPGDFRMARFGRILLI